METETPRIRLETWKQIAAYFGKNQRTVKRWEAVRGLPVRRLPGPGNGRVYADVEELEAWRSSRGISGGQAGLAERLSDRLTGVRTHWGVAALIGVILAALVLAAALGWGPALLRGMNPPSLAAQRSYVQGMDDLRQRTAQSLNRAIDEFHAAIASDPDYADAYAGLAETYDLIREYTAMPASQAFPLARQAATRAVALNSTLAEGHASLAFADYYGFWDADAAHREFADAIALDPRSELAHHWFATFLMERGDSAAALPEINHALALNPTSPAIQADRWLILYAAGRAREAVTGLKALETARPDDLSPHNYLAAIDLIAGDDQDYLREAEWAARLTGDRNRAAVIEAARRGFAASGRQGMLQAVLGEQTAQFQQGLASAYSMAATEALLGDGAAAAADLKLAFRRREPELTDLPNDPAFTSLRSTSAYQALLRQLAPSA